MTAAVKPLDGMTTTATMTAAAAMARTIARSSGGPVSAARPPRRAAGSSCQSAHDRGARNRFGRDQRKRGPERAAGREARQRADAEKDGEDQRRDAIGADPAVVHDLELALRRGPAAEAVDRIGEAVLVQAVGEDHRGQHREAGGRSIRSRRGGARRPEPRRRRGRRARRRPGRRAPRGGNRAARVAPGRSRRAGTRVRKAIAAVRSSATALSSPRNGSSAIDAPAAVAVDRATVIEPPRRPAKEGGLASKEPAFGPARETRRLSMTSAP